MKPIDFVIIWVDGNDPEWRREKSQYDGTAADYSNSEARFRDWDNLQYWFRGVEQFAPWVNKIHFVTWGHLPKWLDTTNPKLNIVNHKDFIPKEYLPTFSSHTIELNLHRIEGLAEQFVYFNDDMFITAPVNPEDFFKNGKPCDTVALDCICFDTDTVGAINGSNAEVINRNFSKRESLKKHFKMWYSPKNGIRNLIRTVLLTPWEYFPGFYYQHVADSFLKSNFVEMWEKEYEVLHRTCSHRFRDNSDVNQWAVKFWQMAKGEVAVRKDSFAYCFHIKENNFDALCERIKSKKNKMLCINDNSNVSDFEAKKAAVIEAFEKLLPEMSSFER